MIAVTKCGTACDVVDDGAKRDGMFSEAMKARLKSRMETQGQDASSLGGFKSEGQYSVKSRVPIWAGPYLSPPSYAVSFSWAVVIAPPPKG